jgi:hypothetical protein
VHDDITAALGVLLYPGRHRGWEMGPWDASAAPIVLVE